MRFSVLASGSGGNACYVETEQTRVLIDVGLSCKEIERRLEVLDVRAGSIDVIVVTHEHMDHVKGVGVFARRYQVPVLINRATLRRCEKIVGNIPAPLFFNTGDRLSFRDLTFHFFTKCHDATDPVGITLSSNGCKLGVLTDLGRSTPLILDSISQCNGLVLEFNHDPLMLEAGPYPLELKRRIKGPDGHLSNQQAAELLRAVVHNDLAVVVLAHLSEINNEEEMAYAEAEKVLRSGGISDIHLLVSRQYEPLPLVDLARGGHV